ncbi:MAG: 4-deoxy-4-formamido-L-arabinose-phosphoundecaprenol deformylase [Burkholderiales bacterium]|nr:4-deoxy-4-formamido-L-arabinose-phosphoundecaprenol deformylase [Burkholderiales bacterium]
MATIALKVDVDTLRGTRAGVPRLLQMLARRGLQATFLFSLGPDHTGWALKRVFRSGFLGKVSRTSVTRHYGWRTLMYGVLLPAPDIGQRAAAQMRAARDAGHECGIHCWDHVVWQDGVRHRDAAWTRAQMALAWQRYGDVFGAAPATHGAAGWQMNDTALQQLDDWGLGWASDGRAVDGGDPYRPMVGGRPLAHVQWPTTLPTLDELIGTEGIDESNVAPALLRRTETDRDQVYTLHAELEGGLLAPAFEALLDGWRAQGHRLGTLGGLHAAHACRPVPALPLAWGQVAGRSGEVVVAPARPRT